MSEIEWPNMEDLQTRFSCLKCEDTGQVWGHDPAFPNMTRCDILVPCQCQKQTEEK
jgi:hypothetical protein